MRSLFLLSGRTTNRIAHGRAGVNNSVTHYADAHRRRVCVQLRQSFAEHILIINRSKSQPASGRSKKKELRFSTRLDARRKKIADRFAANKLGALDAQTGLQLRFYCTQTIQLIPKKIYGVDAFELGRHYSDG